MDTQQPDIEEYFLSAGFGTCDNISPMDVGQPETGKYAVSAGGQSYFVKTHPLDSFDMLGQQHAVRSFLAGAGHPVTSYITPPAPRDQHIITVEPYIEGTQQSDITAEQAGQLGCMLARMHKDTALSEDDTCPHITEKWDNRLQEFITRKARIIQALNNAGIADADVLMEQAITVASSRLGIFLHELAGYPETSLFKSYVHMDVCPNNVLFDSSGNIVALVDFDLGGNGYSMLDLTHMLTHYALDNDRNDVLSSDSMQKLGAMVDGYTSERALTEAENYLFPLFFQARFLDNLLHKMLRIQDAVAADDINGMRFHTEELRGRIAETERYFPEDNSVNQRLSEELLRRTSGFSHVQRHKASRSKSEGNRQNNTVK